MSHPHSPRQHSFHPISRTLLLRRTHRLLHRPLVPISNRQTTTTPHSLRHPPSRHHLHTTTRNRINGLFLPRPSIWSTSLPVLPMQRSPRFSLLLATAIPAVIYPLPPLVFLKTNLLLRRPRIPTPRLSRPLQIHTYHFPTHTPLDPALRARRPCIRRPRPRVEGR